MFSVEIDKSARATYAENWGDIDHDDVRTLDRRALPMHDLLAAGFPCQPFSLAGVSKKISLGRAHGFEDPHSGNLFFEIVRLIGGPWDLDAAELRHEAEAPEDSDDEFAYGTPADGAPGVLLLENVRHLLSHDSGRTYRVIRRRLRRSGYRVSERVINAAAWVPQNRRRTVIVGLRHDMHKEHFVFPEPPDPSIGPVLTTTWLDHPEDLKKYQLTPGTWLALQRHQARHAKKQNGFGFGLAKLGEPTRTLSARYYKDGAEILIPMPDGSFPPRRLTLSECAALMGFVEPFLDQPFRIPSTVSNAQAYRQFGNSVVVPMVTWVGRALAPLAQHGLEETP